MNELRSVIDSGIAVSAVLLPRSVPRQAFELAASRGRLLVSKATVAELDEVLRRPKFNKYVREEKRLEFLAALVRDAVVVEVTDTISACRDEKDDKFLELAQADLDHFPGEAPIRLPAAFPGLLRNPVRSLGHARRSLSDSIAVNRSAVTNAARKLTHSLLQ